MSLQCHAYKIKVTLLCEVAEMCESEKTEAEGITCLISTSETRSSFKVVG